MLHYHIMHDETFLITKGKVGFTTDETEHDAGVGDYVVVPPRAPHTFSNPFEVEAEIFDSFSPAFYVDYLRELHRAGREDWGKEVGRNIMEKYATVPIEVEVVGKGEGDGENQEDKSEN
jgi:oxalate decarboxylase/phosphoglucose isomerase-like protein (cupin superfamily)